MYKYQKGFAPIIITLIVLLLAGVGGTSYYLINKQSQKQIACTAEAKLCPDGSLVGRIGPNCEFAACPEIDTDETVNWKTYTNDQYGYEIRYPSLYNVVESNTRVSGITIGTAAVPAYGISFEFDQSKISSLEKLKSSMEESLRESAPAGLEITWKNIVISGEKAVEMSYVNFAGGYTGVTHKTAVIKNNIGYIIQIIYGGSEKEYYQMLSTFKFTNTQESQQDFSKLNKDELLHKLFPNLSFENGIADLASSGVKLYSDGHGIKLYLEDSIKDYFINNQEKNLLLVVQLGGIPHAGGMYHAYLGLFDKNGNLLTPSSTFPKPNNNTIANYEFDFDKTQFSGDDGQFGFYDCKGTKYVLFVSSGCPNGSCCSAAAKLFRISNGNFENLQTIDSQSLADYGPSYSLKMILSGDKILVKKVPPTSNDGCTETNYKELKWNQSSCKFE